ncbi:MAG: C39 family peptidase [Anaerolineales bacterium]|nr:C39 family peptidase [Anaerolineales bacterium]
MHNPEYLPYRPKKRLWVFILTGLFIAGLIGGLLLMDPTRVWRALKWRTQIAATYIRGVLYPVPDLPTPAVAVQPSMEVITATPDLPTATPQATATPVYTPTPTLVPTPIPMQVQLEPPNYDPVRDKQITNNCGPATLALYLRYFGWEGDQHDIAELIKPIDKDSNVNVEELVYFVRTRAGWLNAEFRVGGDLERLKEIIAVGIPVMIEESFETDRKYRPNDDRWSGHYLLITGYDDSTGEFMAHDSFDGPNQKLSYSEVEESWQSFNHVYIMIYPPEMEGTIQNVLGMDWDADTNRQNALEDALAQTQEDPNNAYTWFNLGSNMVYFERYNEAAEAYNHAREIGLPQRMLRYQFGPFFAYFHSLQTEELITLTKYALLITPASEEAMLWRGWGFYRQGDNEVAIKYFHDALKINPLYEDAQNALTFVNGN